MTGYNLPAPLTAHADTPLLLSDMKVPMQVGGLVAIFYFLPRWHINQLCL